MRRILPALSALCLVLPIAALADRGVVAVYSSGIVLVGTTQQYIVYVGDIVPTTVTWSVNDIAGGNSVIGTISATGLYTAPAVAPTPNVVTVKATSTVNPTKFGTVQVTVQQPTPWVWGVYSQSGTHRSDYIERQWRELRARRCGAVWGRSPYHHLRFGDVVDCNRRGDSLRKSAR